MFPVPAALSVEVIRARSKSTGDPGWLTDVRVEAFERYLKLPAPQWRRTDLGGFDVTGAAASASEAPVRHAALVRAKGVLHLPLAEAAREHPDLVRPLVGASDRADKWEALQAAAWTQGSFLHLERGVELHEPLSLTEPFAASGGLARDVIVLERQSKADLLLRASGGAKGALVQHGVELELRDGADLRLATLQDLDRGATLLAWRRAHLQRDARLAWVDGQFGAGTSVAVNENLLRGPGARLHFIGAFFGSAGQHMDLTTAALHEAPHTEARLDMKGALNEDGYSANYSIVFIGPGARNASGHQHQETLLLSGAARADAIPKLDVENNDVSASHGATVGQVDPDQLFYLRSRGFDELGAKRLVVEGFFDPLLSKIPIEEVREEVRRAIVARLKR